MRPSQTLHARGPVFALALALALAASAEERDCRVPTPPVTRVRAAFTGTVTLHTGKVTRLSLRATSASDGVELLLEGDLQASGLAERAFSSVEGTLSLHRRGPSGTGAVTLVLGAPTARLVDGRFLLDATVQVGGRGGAFAGATGGGQLSLSAASGQGLLANLDVTVLAENPVNLVPPNHYSLVALSHTPGTARAINFRHQVTGEVGFPTPTGTLPTYAMHAYLWSPSTGAVDVDPGPINGPLIKESEGRAVNGNGDVVGTIGSLLGEPVHAFYRQSGGAFVDLDAQLHTGAASGLLEGSVATGINLQRHVVGAVGPNQGPHCLDPLHDGGCHVEAFRWDLNHGVTLLPKSPWAHSSYAAAINSSDMIAGVTSDGPTAWELPATFPQPYFQYQGAFYTLGGYYTALNDKGLFGGSYDYPFCCTAWLFQYKPYLGGGGVNGFYTSLNDFTFKGFGSNSYTSSLEGLNSWGDAVGMVNSYDSQGQFYDSSPYLLHGGMLTRLQGFMPPASEFGTLLTARAINDSGSIVGEGILNYVALYGPEPYMLVPTRLWTLEIDTPTAAAGSTLELTVQLTDPAPFDLVANLAVDGPEFLAPATVKIEQGATTAKLAVHTTAVTAPVVRTFSVSYGGWTVTAQVSLAPVRSATR